MTDLHTHILPEMDDGASSKDVSLEILTSLKSQGVKRVVFTSHYYQHIESVDTFLSRRDKAYDKIKDEIPDGIEIKLGSEMHLTDRNAVRFSELKKLKIGDTRYILTELSKASEWSKHIFTVLDRFIDETDLVPIIAHVEMYPAVRSQPELISKLIDCGCLVQSNCDSFLIPEIRSLVLKMAKKDMIYCLGSDSHNMKKRPPYYREAADVIIKEMGEEYFKRLQRDTEKIFNGENVKIRPYKSSIKKFFGKYI